MHFTLREGIYDSKSTFLYGSKCIRWDIYKTYYTSQREIFHKPKGSEISRHISQLTSVISDLFLQCTMYVTTNKSKECL